MTPQIPAPGSGDVIGGHGMVASAHPTASAVGVRCLQAGGNAVDAAIATAFALNVVEAQASGIGGGGFLLVKMKNQPAQVIDYRETAPTRATPQFYYQQESTFEKLAEYGPHSVCVPGMLAGLELAREKFGTKSLAELMRPAIGIAEQGFPVDAKLADLILNRYEIISQDAETANIFLHDLMPPEPGFLIKRPDLAETFSVIAAEGIQAFYSGEIAREIVTAAPLISLNDLAQYQPGIRLPVRGKYRNFEIITVPPPSSGGVHLLQTLNILSGFDLRNYAHNSADYIHLFAEALKFVYTDRQVYAADPAFFPVPVADLLRTEYAKQIRNKIHPQQINHSVSPGIFQPGNAGNTTHLSVVDAAGNMVALTQTINHFFGSGMTVRGILLNDEIADFSAEPTSKNAVAPGKRPVSTMAPTFVLREGQPFLTIGTPGGNRIISALAQILVNVIDFKMPVDAAIEAPRFHCEGDEIFMESRIDSAVVQRLREMGHTVTVKSDFDVFFGGAQGILIDTPNARLLGGADSRRSGVAVGF